MVFFYGFANFATILVAQIPSVFDKKPGYPLYPESKVE
jgi:hypothetical protein